MSTSLFSATLHTGQSVFGLYPPRGTFPKLFAIIQQTWTCFILLELFSRTYFNLSFAFSSISVSCSILFIRYDLKSSSSDGHSLGRRSFERVAANGSKCVLNLVISLFFAALDDFLSLPVPDPVFFRNVVCFTFLPPKSKR